MQSQKWQNDLCSSLRQTIQHNSNLIQIYAPITDAKEAEVDRFYEDLQNLPEHQKEKKMSFLS